MLRIITFMSALLFASAAAATQLYIDAPKDGYLNLRAGPSTGYDVISKMKHASPVHVIKAPGKWYKVRDNRGYVGWAHSGYMSKHPKRAYDTPHQSHVKPYKMYVNAPRHSGLNLRNGPGRNYSVLYTMGQGSRVTVLKTSGKWAFLKHKSGHKGWAHKTYLAAHKPYVNNHTPRHYTPHTPPHKPRHKPHYSNRQLQQAIWYCSQRPAHRQQRCIARQLGQI